MATPKAQRIGIWIITVVMTFGVIGSFLVMILGSQNQTKEQQQQQQALAAQQKQQEQQQAEAAKLSDKYYPVFKKYEATPNQFDPTTVGKTVATKDLKAGTGATLSKSTSYQAYYIGWDPDGKVFDSSFSSGALAGPLDATPGGLIPGWESGVVGMKAGGIRELTIPSDLAYGASGSVNPNTGEMVIKPNTPLKFIVYVIKTTK